MQDLPPMSRQGKRIILCLDGTWVNSDDGYQKGTILNPKASLQIPSNITRIFRALKKTGRDGKVQIVYYHRGVGTGAGFANQIAGGLFGAGISENIREAYSFVTGNYSPGDEIIILGFSRGAFTARSIAGLIGQIGLLTVEGMAMFFPIFKDAENARDGTYRDMFPEMPFADKPRNRDDTLDEPLYRERLEKLHLTRTHDEDGHPIRVRCVGVWDTVGSLGIPDIDLLSRLGLPRSTREFKFYDTSLSNTITHAFQALALDEHRAPFSPAVWERPPGTTTDLRQVWFPGCHSNVGGGSYADEGLANASLAWMMDQLASLGVAFKDDTIARIHASSTDFYTHPPPPHDSLLATLTRKLLRPPWKQWAITPIYLAHKPVRPWGLGTVYENQTGVYALAGRRVRTPGLYRRVDPETGRPTRVPLVDTNERVHRSVRVRAELQGLSYGDVGLYQAEALTAHGWRAVRRRVGGDVTEDPISPLAVWSAGRDLQRPESGEGEEEGVRWVWEHSGGVEGKKGPKRKVMVEEPLGPYERELLRLSSKGNDGVEDEKLLRLVGGG